jgi:DNA-binding HxlR family transcriptional regulator
MSTPVFGVTGMESLGIESIDVGRSAALSRLLERVEGAAKKSLTSTLRGLERNVLVRIIAQVPIRVEYEVLALGHELIVKFQPFSSWSGKVGLPKLRGLTLYRATVQSNFRQPIQADSTA